MAKLIIALLVIGVGGGLILALSDDRELYDLDERDEWDES